MDALQKAKYNAHELGTTIKHLERRRAPITLRLARRLWARQLGKYDDPFYLNAIQKAFDDAYKWTVPAVEDEDDVSRMAAGYGTQVRLLKDPDRTRVAREWRAYRDGLESSEKQAAANVVYWTAYWAAKPIA